MGCLDAGAGEGRQWFSDGAVTDKQLTDEYAGDTRDELWEGITRLRTWVGKVKKGNSLVLSMDGDQ